MSSLKLINILLLAALLSACTMTAPFVDRRREAGAPAEQPLYIGQSTESEPAICYNAWSTSIAEVKKLATAECLKNGTGNFAQPTHQTLFTCRALIPHHLYFKCINK